MNLLNRFLNRPASRDDFASLVLQRLGADSPAKTFTYDSPTFALRDGGGRTLYLANYYTEYLKRGRHERRSVLAQVAATAAAPEPELPPTLDLARSHLLPVLRNLPCLEAVLLETSAADPSIWAERLPMRNLGRYLNVGVAYDTRNGILQVPDSVLASWGLNFDAACAIALDNLRHKEPPKFRQVTPGTYIAIYGDCYDAARILLPELARQLAVVGEPVAMVPTRDCLVISGDRDEAGQSLMTAIAAQALETNSRVLTAEAFRLEGAEWKPWQPNGVSARHHHKQVVALLSGQYKSQREVLTRVLKARGDDVFVATYSGMERSDGVAFSYATLTLGVDTLLPEVDYVVLVELPVVLSESAACRWVLTWGTFCQECGAHMRPTPHVLPRYRVQFKPSADQLATLRGLTEELGGPRIAS